MLILAHRLTGGTLWPVAAITLLMACSSPPVRTQVGLAVQMDSGTALNSRTGRYRVAGAEIALTKVVSLPRDQLGLRFVISAPTLQGGCCGVFPRLALVGRGSTSGTTHEIDVAEDRTSVAGDGTMTLSLFGGHPVRRLGSFAADLSGIGVRL